jgi:hypothetical protein
MWFQAAIWFVGGTLASVGYVLGTFDIPEAGLIALITFPLGTEVRAIFACLGR